MNTRELITRRIAKELKEGDVVNLGVGMPTMVANYVPSDVHIMLQAENGMLGMGELPEGAPKSLDCIDAGGNHVSCKLGGAFFDSATSFAIIRGGHVDITVLGALEVDERGNLANWMIPGKMVPGMGGAMDLVVGAKRVIVAMEHTNKNGAPKILDKCLLPLTAVGVVDMVVTNMGVFDITDKGVVIREIAPDVTIEQVINSTGAKLIVPEDLKIMETE